ncbi:MAG TPA: NADH-quinone oxidoreductase subunit M [Candidatus Tyrphobacter sp.]
MLALVIVLLPIAAGALLFLLPRDDIRISKSIGAVVAAGVLVLAIADRGESWSWRWFSHPFVAEIHFGSTYLSHWLIVLLALCTFCAVLASNVARTRGMIAALLILEGTMAGLFLARDLLLFALFWDAMLLPVFFVLLNWTAHPATAWRYFIYNFAGGLTLLLAVAAFGALYGSTDVIGNPAYHAVAGAWAPWILAGFAFAFLVKTPVWPLHTWMPPSYEEMPAPMVAVVSAVQSKAGLYGFIAIGLALFPSSFRQEVPVLVILAVISLLYGALIALVQTDAKRVVAYSSLSHLGLILLAIASQNPLALSGALVYIVAHGLFSAALFLVIGYVEEREETRSLARLGGLGWANPRLTGAFCIAALAALGLPGLAGFVGELIVLIGVYQAGLGWAAVLALIAIVIASAYMLRLLQGATNGPEVPDLPIRRDLSLIEGLAVAPLLAALLYFGIYPHALLVLTR